MAIHKMTIGPLVNAVIVDDAVDDFINVDSASDDDVFVAGGGNGAFTPVPIAASASLVSPTGAWIDNEMVRFHGASGGAAVIQGTDIIIDDSANMTAVNDITLDGNLNTNGFEANIVAKTTTYTITAADHTVLCDASGGAFTVTLPAVSGVTGLILNIKKTDSSGNAVTIDAAGSETIDSALTVVISTQYESVTIQCDGTEWWII